MHNGCHSTRSLRIHGLAYSASRRADWLCKLTRRAPIHASSQSRAVAGAHEQNRGAVAVAAMIYLTVM